MPIKKFNTDNRFKMMLLNDINDNILMYHPSYLGVYQYEA